MNIGRPAKSTRTFFGSRLYEARKDKGLSQQQVADSLGIPVKTYANWERRSVGIKPEHLVCLAKTLSVSLDWLFNVPSVHRKLHGPTGKARNVFEQVSQMPRSQQSRILNAVDDMIAGIIAKES